MSDARGDSGRAIAALIEWAVSVRYDDIPPAVLAKAGLVIADDLAAMIAARDEPEVRRVHDRLLGCVSAQEATVSLKMLKQGVRLSIRDNGSGFNTDTAKGTGQGLHNMAARAQKIGGRLTVSSKINKGTRVVFDLPKETSSARR